MACCALFIIPPSPNAAFIVTVARIISITIVITNATKVIPARLKAIKNEEFKESDGAAEAKEEPVVLPELDEGCDYKEKSSKFNRDGFKFDDDFYGECIHKDCDKDDEIEMIFDDDPTLSY